MNPLPRRRAAIVFTFRPGRTFQAEGMQKTKIAPGSYSNWAYYAVPESPGRSGFRSFCIDESSVLRQTTDGSLPDTSRPVCPLTMTILR